VSADRIIAILLGVMMIGFGVNGLRIGKVLTKTVRPPWPGYTYRDKEPVAFWVTVCIWIALGTLGITIVLLTKVPAK
jgi:hypothetical protein